MATIDKKRQQAAAILNAIGGELKRKFESYKEVLYNPNTKGGDYEKVISSPLTNYLGSNFDFYNRAQLIDREMDYLTVFPYGGNEFDVIATFKHVSPKIVAKIEETIFIPYDAVAFIIEVKAKMAKETLIADLDKLAKIDKLTLTPGRFEGAVLRGPYAIERPLRALFYFDASIDEAVKENLLDEYYNAWDVILIIQKNEIMLNRSLPFVNKIMSDRSANGDVLIWTGDNCFIMLLTIISASMPNPISVNVIHTLLRIDEFSKVK